MRLLILRPQPGADATAALALNLGLEPIIMPLFEIVRLSWDMPDHRAYDALLLTSANAARALAPHAAALGALPVHAVGPATAKAAQEAGFRIASTGQADAATAIANAQISGHPRLLWLTGADHIALDPPVNGVLDIVPIYLSRRILPDDAMIDAIRTCPAVALHSPRAARHFAELVTQAGLDRSRITLVALSPEIAQAAAVGWHGVLVAQTPDDDAMLRLTQSYFTTP